MKIIRTDYLKQIDHRRGKIKGHIVFLSLAVCIVILYAAFSTIVMKKQDAAVTLEYVQAYADQYGDMIRMETDHHIAALSGLREFIREGKPLDEIQREMERQKQTYELDFIGFYDADARPVAEVGQIPADKESGLGLEQDMYFWQDTDENGCAVSVIEDTVLYAAVLEQGDDYRGVLLAGCSTSDLQEIISMKVFQSRGLAYVIGPGEKLLFHSDTVENPNILSYVMTQTEDEKLLSYVTQMRQDIENNKNGVFKFQTPEHKSYYLAYDSMCVKGWTAIMVVPVDLFIGFSDSYVQQMLGCLLALLMIFGVFLVLLFREYGRGRQTLEQLAFVDEVTGGINRAEFRLRYGELCRKHQADQYAIALLDAVDFKMVNENFGPETGDRVLRYFYEKITESLDIGRGEFASRTEMDHFFLCMKERDPERIKERLSRMIGHIRMMIPQELPAYKPEFRQGVSLPKDDQTDISMVQDQARAAAKSRAGLEECIFYDNEIARRMQRERELDMLFETSIRTDAFLVYLQPKVSLSGQCITGAEALVRWNCPGIGLISPGEFIPLLEKSGKIRILDRYIFELVCRWLYDRKKQGKVLFPISVNLSRKNFFDEQFLAEFDKLAQLYEIDRSLIEFEVTETFFLDDNNIKKVQEGIELLHQYGFCCALDDFGSGFSSLTLIKDFQINVLKMDRSFFTALDDSKAQNIIACVLELASRLQIETVAEGIETKEQVICLGSLGCDVIQGYFFSKPLPIAEFERWADSFCFDDYLKSSDGLPDFSGGGMENTAGRDPVS